MSVYVSGRARGSWEPQKRRNADIPPAPPPAIEQKADKPPQPHGSPRRRDLLGGILPDGIDSDTLLIAALLFLLLKEGGDIKLVIALGYILL
ncbi:hypothetical protein SAMN02910353_01722 [Ruminococcus sp. YRD2003]|uniref:hypothetical protein n=1 Tax=Ruminococcus sp. YRD2003 TaxID=1452313 RepID=UPI0008D66D31|nr:hypothetical protein [Ruminococcus sp.]SEL01622.1 hypothetical protein SAMN02910353_01722 [Ruminococcus flavefaciens]